MRNLICWIFHHKMGFVGRSFHELGFVEHQQCYRCPHHIRILHVTHLNLKGPIRGVNADSIVYEDAE